MDQLPHFNIIDVMVAVLIVLGLIRGVVKGLSGELAGLLSAAAAVTGAWYFYTPLGNFLADKTRLSEPATVAVAFVLALVGAYILMRILRLVLRHVMEFSFKGKIEKIGGMLAGGIRMTVIVAALVLLMALWPHDYLHRLFAEESVFGRFVFEKLGPVYEQIAEEHPALQIPRKEESVVEDVDDSEPMTDQEVPAE
jgi:membrane protein required for colicin V production